MFVRLFPWMLSFLILANAMRTFAESRPSEDESFAKAFAAAQADATARVARAMKTARREAIDRPSAASPGMRAPLPAAGQGPIRAWRW